jgi:hypothetical protein
MSNDKNPRDQSETPKATDNQRRQNVDDLNNLGLLSFTDKTGLTPLDTLFDETAAPTKEDSKVRPIL